MKRGQAGGVASAVAEASGRTVVIFFVRLDVTWLQLTVASIGSCVCRDLIPLMAAGKPLPSHCLGKIANSVFVMTRPTAADQRRASSL